MNNLDNILTPSKKIAVVSDPNVGDWIGVYVDDELIHEGHSIRGEEMLELLGIAYEHVDAEIDMRLPKELKEVNRI